MDLPDVQPPHPLIDFLGDVEKMSKKYIISPSILSSDFTRLGEQISEAEAGGTDWIHVDVMDGHFVPNLTMGPVIVRACRRITSLPLDIHLMVYSPELYIKDFAESGASLIYVHIESNPNLHRTLQNIHELGCKAGVVLNPGTPAGAAEAILSMVDVVLVMTVNPGYSGQEFIPEVVPKIAQVRKALDAINPAGLIAVDGGITHETLPLTLQAGAQVFIAGNAVFKHPGGIRSGIQALRADLPV